MKKREYSPEYKTRIVLEVLEGKLLVSEIAAGEGINPNMVSMWKTEFLKNAHKAFSTKREEKQMAKERESAEERERELLSKVGILTMENDWLKKKSKEIRGVR
jgi:putative transposase